MVQYRVIVNYLDGSSHEYYTQDLEDALREWDGLTWDQSGSTGGIEVKAWSNGLCVRDGWLLHVKSGVTYINPSLHRGEDQL